MQESLSPTSGREKVIGGFTWELPRHGRKWGSKPNTSSEAITRRYKKKLKLPRNRTAPRILPTIKRESIMPVSQNSRCLLPVARRASLIWGYLQRNTHDLNSRMLAKVRCLERVSFGVKLLHRRLRRKFVVTSKFSDNRLIRFRWLMRGMLVFKWRWGTDLGMAWTAIPDVLKKLILLILACKRVRPAYCTCFFLSSFILVSYLKHQAMFVISVVHFRK